MSHDDHGFNTRLVHAGEPRPRSMGAVAMPIYQSSTFEQEPGNVEYGSLKYIRLNNLPNQTAIADKLAVLEGAEAGVVTGSGMAAVSTALLSVLKSGDHLLAQDVLYGGTRTFLAQDLPRLGIEVSFVAEDDPAAWEAARRENTRAVYVESLTNPMLHVGDLPGIAAFARERGLVSMIDNTIPTPLYFRPIEHGFDLSIHSATKFLNGHSDIVAGVILGSKELVGHAVHALNHLGGSLDPHACSLLLRGLRTLKLRMEHQARTAQRFAEFLVAHERVETVYYPGLESHPSHERAKRWMDGYGALLSFRVHGGADAAERVLRAVKLPIDAPSFGGVESLITRPAGSSHAGLSDEERDRLGITPSLLRVAVGIEDAEDLIADFDQALSA